MSKPSTFKLDNVSVRYPTTHAIRQVSLEVTAGEMVAFVGPSGAGKTTLLRCLNGMVRCTAGEVQVLGEALRHLNSRQLRNVRAGIGFVPQQLGLVPNLRVIQNVVAGRLGRKSLVGSLRSMLFPAQSEIVEVHKLLGQVGIEDKLYERTDRLSGGEQQRVAIARALFQQPQAMLADEPVSSVDPARARDTIRLLTEVATGQGLTLCVSLHNLELAREFFPRLIGLRGGSVVFDQRSDQFSEQTFRELYQLPHEKLLPSAANSSTV